MEKPTNLEIPEEMHERILLLMNNKNLAQRKLGKNPKNDPIMPNCYGTSAFILGLNDLVRELWVSHGFQLNDSSKSPRGDFVFADSANFPGYIGRWPMTLLLNNLKKTEKTPGAIVAYFYEDPLNPSCRELNLRHTGVHLFNSDGIDYSFHQIAHGEDWGYARGTDLENSLGEIQRATLQVRYFLQ